MKKYFIMLAMLFAMNVSVFAEDNNSSEIEIVKRYDIQVNTKKLGECLNLTTDQYDAVGTIVNELSNDLLFAAVECSNSSRDMVTKNAIDKNIKNMSYILNQEQYRKYLMVLNATVRNRNINVIE